MDRRKFLLAAAALPLCAHAQPKNMKDIQTLQNNWKNCLPAGVTVPLPTEPLKLSKEEWKKRLPDQLAYRVLREEATERAGRSEERRVGKECRSRGSRRR